MEHHLVGEVSDRAGDEVGAQGDEAVALVDVGSGAAVVEVDRRIANALAAQSVEVSVQFEAARGVLM